MPRLDNKNILYIVAQLNFRDEELLEPKSALEEEGAKITVASITMDEAVGMFGTRIAPDITAREANPNDYDMLIVAGGSGSPKLADYPEVLDLIRRFKDQDKPIAAICLGGYVLARAGALEGKRATVWPADFALAEYRRAGVNYVDEGVVRERKLITAKGPENIKEFEREIIKLLSES